MPTVRSVRIYRGYKTELEPTKAQARALRQHVGVARWAYNWGLSRKVECRQQSAPSPNWMGPSLELNRRKRAEFPWLYEVSKAAPIEAFKDLDQAFVSFFRRGRRRVGFPRFKRKRDDLGSCRFRGVIHVSQRSIQCRESDEFA